MRLMSSNPTGWLSRKYSSRASSNRIFCRAFGWFNRMKLSTTYFIRLHVRRSPFKSASESHSNKSLTQSSSFSFKMSGTDWAIGMTSRFGPTVGFWPHLLFKPLMFDLKNHNEKHLFVKQIRNDKLFHTKMMIESKMEGPKTFTFVRHPNASMK